MHMESTLDRDLHDRILEHAEFTRDWAERLAARREGVRRSEDLCGYCAIASARLWSRLTAAGIPARLHEAVDWANHVYVVVDDHVVDITATQFSQFRTRPIIIQHTRFAEEYWWWRPLRQFASDVELRQHQVRAGWPQNQIVLRGR